MLSRQLSSSRGHARVCKNLEPIGAEEVARRAVGQRDGHPRQAECALVLDELTRLRLYTAARVSSRSAGRTHSLLAAETLFSISDRSSASGSLRSARIVG